MKVLIIGSGGREHAIAWKIAQSEQVDKVFVAPGNAGTAHENKTENVAIDVLEIKQLKKFAKKHAIDLTIVGPEAPLVAGIVDRFRQHNLVCFGPSQSAAQLEGSKAFTKDFLSKYHIPTARYQVFTVLEQAKQYLKSESFPVVIKADGLAAGKGVVIAENYEQGEQALVGMLQDNRFGQAGHRVVIEEFMQGEEASFIIIADGEDFVPFASSQDHKARDNGDKGPNTGGMGAYSPAPIVTDEVYERIIEKIIKPTLSGMTNDGNRYTGFLYAGLMIDSQGNPKVLEFNCRLGDPETQPLLMRLDSDLCELLLLATSSQLSKASVNWNPKIALGVVLAAGGYPNDYNRGDMISGLSKVENVSDVKVFHAGTKQENEYILTAGGRVLCVTALGDTVRDAQQSAYSAISHIKWTNIYFRTDIGYKAI